MDYNDYYDYYGGAGDENNDKLSHILDDYVKSITNSPDYVKDFIRLFVNNKIDEEIY